MDKSELKILLLYIKLFLSDVPGYLYYNATVTRSDHMTCLQADDPS